VARVGSDVLRLRLQQRLADLAATGRGDLREVVGEFRRGEVLVPVVDGALLSVEAGGIRWLLVFTDDAALERFAGARGEAVPERVPVYGAHLLDQVIPEAARVSGPVGIAVDAGSAADRVA
jgi:hypothetical protein